MVNQNKETAGPAPDDGIKRRGLLRLGTLVTAFSGATAISALGGNSASAAAGQTSLPMAYVPIAEKGVASGVATLDTASKLPPAQLPDLSATYAGTQSIAVPQLSSIEKRGRFGKVGTSGKGVISIRFDHQLDPFMKKVQPLMDARRLPYSMGVVSRSVGNPAAAYEPTVTTWADVKTKILNLGGEIWGHSATHGDGISAYDEIVKSKAEIEAQGIRVIGYQQPGTTSYATQHTSFSAMNDEPGRLIRENYGLYETSIQGSSRRAIPTDGCFGYDHVSLDTRNYAWAKIVIDEAAAYKTGIQLMIHAEALDQAGKMTTPDFALMLDYLVTLRDAGKIEVLTASGLAFADPGSNHRPSIVPYGDFEGQITGTVPAPWADSGPAWNIQADGGHSGQNYLRVTSGLAICKTQATAYGIDGFPFMLEGWARATTQPSQYRIGATSLIGSLNTNVRNTLGNIAPTDGWRFFRAPFVIPKGSDLIKVYVGVNSAGPIDFDDLRCVAI
jgi:hypothetical protein